jgi:hypothetical protein
MLILYKGLRLLFCPARAKMKAVLLMVFALLATVAFAQLGKVCSDSDLVEPIPSRCEYNYADYSSKFKQRLCDNLSKSKCESRYFCYWRDTTAQNKLAEHNQIFLSPAVHQVASNVYVAVGYALSNVALVVGDTGAIIVDTTESTAAMNAVLAAFRQVHDFQARPVKAVVYTHSHPDHWAGVAALASVGVRPYIPTNPGGPVAQGATPIYAHSSFVSTLSSASAAFSAILPRSASQFGVNLTADADGRVR